MLPSRLFFLSALLAALIAGKALAHLPENFIDLPDEVQAVILEYAFFSEKATKVWGKDFETSSVHHLIKYLDDFHTKVNIDFTQGRIRVESEGAKDPRQALQHAIEATLLTPADPNAVDLYTAADMGLTGKPFLSGLIKDAQGNNIDTPARATHFAQYLTRERLQQRGNRYWVEISMVRNFKQQGARHYQGMAQRSAQRYRVDSALILAIMETESSFNPFAVSPSGAYGLMQVMQATAGKDVYEKIYRKEGKPSRDFLLNPQNNIDTGTAYLAILRDQYLRGIRHPLAQEYCIVAAYNGGAGNLLRTFHRNRSEALEIINSMSPKDVYETILSDHPQEESRNYLKKVMRVKQQYVQS